MVILDKLFKSICKRFDMKEIKLDALTTLALGEEVSSLSLGEEFTTLAIGEEHPETTTSYGEENVVAPSTTGQGGPFGAY